MNYSLRECLPNQYAVVIDGVSVAWVIQCKHDLKWYWCNVAGWKDDKGQGHYWTSNEAADNFIASKGEDKLLKRIEAIKQKRKLV